jgi:hypothetical protein
MLGFFRAFVKAADLTEEELVNRQRDELKGWLKW